MRDAANGDIGIALCAMTERIDVCSNSSPELFVMLSSAAVVVEDASIQAPFPANLTMKTD